MCAAMSVLLFIEKLADEEIVSNLSPRGVRN